MKQLLYSGSVKNVYLDQNDLLFEFTDQYSVFDWGKMPDLIPNKGEYLNQMGSLFFEYLEKQGIKTHFIKQEAKNIMRVQKVEVIMPKQHVSRTNYENSKSSKNTEISKNINSTYCYKEYLSKPVQTLVPLEFIFRFGCPKGSSLLKRKWDADSLKELGLLKAPQENEEFLEPIIELTTKLEPQDRLLTKTQALDICSMTEEELEKAIQFTKKVALCLKNIFDRTEYKLWDGKVELAFIKGSESRDFMLVDSIGPDELRLQTKSGELSSKEILRQFYLKTDWYNELQQNKIKYSQEYQKVTSAPPRLDNVVLEQVQKQYFNLYLALKEFIRPHIVIFGSGGREHAIVKHLFKFYPLCNITLIGPNSGLEDFENVVVLDLKNLEQFKKLGIEFDYAIVGSEFWVAQGVKNWCVENNKKCLSPYFEHSILESSKIFAKKMMNKYQVPTAESIEIHNEQDLKKVLDNPPKWQNGYVIKYDGLAQGKGVIVAGHNLKPACDAITKKFGFPFLIEEKLIGKELSYFTLNSGDTKILLSSCCDYKKLNASQDAPNTGGMGAYSPCDFLDQKDQEQINKILQSTQKILRELEQKTKKQYEGFLFFGFLKTEHKIYLLEYNVRLGDPEAQVLLPCLNECIIDIYENISKYKDHAVVNKNIKAIHVVATHPNYPETHDDKEEIEILPLRPSKNLDVELIIAGINKKNNKLLASMGRVLGLTVKDSNMASAQKKLYQLSQNLIPKNLYYRKDIGEHFSE